MGLNSVKVTHDFMKRMVRPGDLCIDATAGRGRDTAFLCELVGASGRVLAFDIQQAAADATRDLLQARGLEQVGQVILDSHCHMERYAQAESVALICFNFGYLPGGDHQVYTTAQTSIPALEAGLRLLRPGGGMSLCLYAGGDTGYAERDALLAYVQALDSRRYTVLTCAFANRPNDPPLPVCLLKEG